MITIQKFKATAAVTILLFGLGGCTVIGAGVGAALGSGTGVGVVGGAVIGGVVGYQVGD